MRLRVLVGLELAGTNVMALCFAGVKVGGELDCGGGAMAAVCCCFVWFGGRGVWLVSAVAPWYLRVEPL